MSICQRRITGTLALRELLVMVVTRATIWLATGNTLGNQHHIVCEYPQCNPDIWFLPGNPTLDRNIHKTIFWLYQMGTPTYDYMVVAYNKLTYLSSLNFIILLFQKRLVMYF